jgi:hypothetical protein
MEIADEASSLAGRFSVHIGVLDCVDYARVTDQRRAEVIIIDNMTANRPGTEQGSQPNRWGAHLNLLF